MYVCVCVCVSLKAETGTLLNLCDRSEFKASKEAGICEADF